MQIKAGTVSDFTGSMAQAMEEAMKKEYQAIKGEPLPDMGVEDRRMLFAAIAQGVVRHLKDNVDAFDVSTILHPSSTATTTVDDIQTTGTLY